MGLLDGTTQNAYYQGGEKGSYQFTSLEDIINQFLVAYVGEEKIINKVSRTDVAFHAQRAMQELSFDTFKSIKSQEIVLPPSNTMILPHDYVSYAKLSWSDSAGIKHILYPTSKTSNPFKIQQNDDLTYDFTIPAVAVITNGDFSEAFGQTGGWTGSPHHGSQFGSALGIVNGQYEWTHTTQGLNGSYTGRHFAIWQEIDVSDIDTITITAKGLSSAASSGKSAGTVRVGLSNFIDFNQTNATSGYDPNRTNPNLTNNPSRNLDPLVFDLQTITGLSSYIEFNDGSGSMSADTTLEDIDVSGLNTVYLLAVSDGGQTTSSAANGTNAIDDIVLTFDGVSSGLQTTGDSTTWTNYKSATPSENQDDYQDDTYWPNNQKRYGLDPQHAQVNGSFYIDNLRGLINFSSNISGKTVILDYISDSLGTDGEMQVHKFAEEAMYRWILHAIAAGRMQTQQLVPRLKKEKTAAIRQAKLRLSNIKLEELTQTLRGKSKHIKH
jgi:hypothetical protein